MDQANIPRWQVTGRFVLICFIGFFAVIFAVNATMARFAITTFGGVEVGSSYKAGLKFGSDRYEADQQDKLGWHVEGRIEKGDNRQPVLNLEVRDGAGALVPGLAIRARLAHPADMKRDQEIAMHQAGPGVFRGDLETDRGQWELKIDLTRGEERVFRSQSRINLR